MRFLLLLLLAPASASRLVPDFKSRIEMIQDSDIIARVKITSVHASRKDQGLNLIQEPGMTLSVVVLESIKGKMPSVARVHVDNWDRWVKWPHPKRGEYLIFVVDSKDQLENLNWHLSLRPIKDGVVDWISDDGERNPKILKMNTELVIDQIKKELAVQH